MEENMEKESAEENLLTSVEAMHSKAEMARLELEQTQAKIALKTQLIKRERERLQQQESEFKMLKQKMQTTNEKYLKAEACLKRKENERLSLLKEIADIQKKQNQVDYQLKKVHSSVAKNSETQAKHIESVKMAEAELESEFDREYESLRKEVENLQGMQKQLKEGDKWMLSIANGQAVASVFAQMEAIKLSVEEEEEAVANLKYVLQNKEEMLLGLQEQLANDDVNRQANIQLLQRQLEELKREKQENIRGSRENASFRSTKGKHCTNDMNEMESDSMMILVEETTESDEEMAAIPDF